MRNSKLCLFPWGCYVHPENFFISLATLDIIIGLYCAGLAGLPTSSKGLVIASRVISSTMGALIVIFSIAGIASYLRSGELGKALQKGYIWGRLVVGVIGGISVIGFGISGLVGGDWPQLERRVGFGLLLALALAAWIWVIFTFWEAKKIFGLPSDHTQGENDSDRHRHDAETVRLKL